MEQQKTNIKEMAGLSSAIISLFVGKLRGLEGEEMNNSIYNGYRIGKNAAENNAYIGQRPLDNAILNKLYGVSLVPFPDLLNLETEHEQIFFEDEEGGNIGFFEDGKVKSDDEKNLLRYERSDDPQDNRHYDDAIMREAVKNVETKSYHVIWTWKDDGKYNCQDFINDVRKEYNRLEKEKTQFNSK